MFGRLQENTVYRLAVVMKHPGKKKLENKVDH